MAYDLNKLARLQAISDLATRIQNKFNALQAADVSLKGVSVVGNSLKFFTSTDTSTTPAFSIDLPAEMFLDSVSTGLVPNFAFSAATYEGATDPNLNGKPVLVLGIKTRNNDGVSETISYSFLDMSTLVDVYTASDTSIIITDYKVKVNVSADSDNMLATTANGLYVDGSGKVDKVTNATAGNIAAFVAGGNVSDTGIVGADIIVKDTNATASNIPAYTADGKFTDTGITSSDIIVKNTAATAGNLATYTSDGGISDVGIAIATSAEVNEMLDSIFGILGISASVSSTSDFFSTDATTFHTFLANAVNSNNYNNDSNERVFTICLNDGSSNFSSVTVDYGDIYDLLESDTATVQDFVSLINSKIQGATPAVNLTASFDNSTLTFTNNDTSTTAKVLVDIQVGTGNLGNNILKDLHDNASDQSAFSFEDDYWSISLESSAN